MVYSNLTLKISLVILLLIVIVYIYTLHIETFATTSSHLLNHHKSSQLI